MTIGDALIRLSHQPTDQAAAAALLHHATRIAAGVLKRPQDSDEVQEAAQTCAVQLWERAYLGSLDLASVTSPDGYAHRCVRNSCLEQLRTLYHELPAAARARIDADLPAAAKASLGRAV